MSDTEFRQIRDIVWRTTGISLADSKKALIISRLARRLNELKLQSFLNYIQRLKSDADEVLFMINRITTNLTRFYREPGQFEVLKERVLPVVMAAKKRKPEKTLRIWSAGCSTGEEVYTILFEVLDFFKGTVPAGIDFKLLGTDIDTNVLRKAASGEYSRDELKGLDDARRDRYFRPSRGGRFKIRERFRRHAGFSKHNLVYDVFHFKHPIDVVFCRNVVIYFDRDTKKTLYDKFHGVINEPGFFFSGHSENLFRHSHFFKFLGKGVYEKVL